MVVEKCFNVIVELKTGRKVISINEVVLDSRKIFMAYIAPLNPDSHKNYGTGASIEFAVADLLRKQGMIEQYDTEGNYSLSYPTEN